NVTIDFATEPVDNWDPFCWPHRGEACARWRWVSVECLAAIQLLVLQGRGKLTRLRPPHQKDECRLTEQAWRGGKYASPPRHADSFAPNYRPERSLRLRAGGLQRLATARRAAADRHAARCASRDLCSGGAPRRYTPSTDGMIRRRKTQGGTHDAIRSTGDR